MMCNIVKAKIVTFTVLLCLSDSSSEWGNYRTFNDSPILDYVLTGLLGDIFSV